MKKRYFILTFFAVLMLLATPALAKTYIFEDALSISLPNDWTVTENTEDPQQFTISFHGTAPEFAQIDLYVAPGSTIYDRDQLTAMVEEQYAFAQAKVLSVYSSSGVPQAYWLGQVENGPVFGATCANAGRSYTFLYGGYTDETHSSMRELTNDDFSQLTYIASSLQTNRFNFMPDGVNAEYPYALVTYTDINGNSIPYAMEKEYLDAATAKTSEKNGVTTITHISADYGELISTLQIVPDEDKLPVIQYYDYKGVHEYTLRYNKETGVWILYDADGAVSETRYFDADGLWTIEKGDSVTAYRPDGIRIQTSLDNAGQLETRRFYNGKKNIRSEQYTNGALVSITFFNEDGFKVSEYYENGQLTERRIYPDDGSRITETYNASGELLRTLREVMNTEHRYVRANSVASEGQSALYAYVPFEMKTYESYDAAMAPYRSLIINEDTSSKDGVTKHYIRYYFENAEGTQVQNAMEVYDENMNPISIHFCVYEGEGNEYNYFFTYNGDGTPKFIIYRADGKTMTYRAAFDENGQWIVSYYGADGKSVERIEAGDAPVPLF